MAEVRTKPAAVDVDAFLDAVPDPQKREDGRRLRTLIERISGEKARMWGPSIIGCGSYHYCYESGHEGDMARIGFSPRAKELVLYLVPGFVGREDTLARLGMHRTGKSCLYIKRLSDIDEGALEELITGSLEYLNEKYPATGS